MTSCGPIRGPHLLGPEAFPFAPHLTIGDIFFAFRGESQQLEADAKAAGEKAGGTLGQSMRQGLQRHATRMATAGGAAVGLFVADAAQQFGRFDAGMREVFTLLPNESQATFDQLTAQVKQFSTDFGVLPEDVIPSLYNAISAGIPAGNVFDFLEVANQAAKAGAASTDEAVQLLSQSVNAWQLDVGEAGRVSDAMFTTVRLGVTNFPALAANMSKVSGQAAVMGVSVEEVGAAVAQLTKVGQPTEQAMTNLGATFTLLQKGTPELTKVLQAMGFENGQAAIEALGLQGTLEGIRDTSDRLGIALPKMTGRVQAANAIFGLTGDNAEAANGILGEFNDTTGATGKAFEVMDSGVTAAANRIAARMRVMAIEVGQAIEPIAPLFIAFGPTIGRALGAAIGAGAGLVVRFLPALLAPLVSGITSIVGATPLGPALASASARAAPMAASAGSMLGRIFGLAFKAAAVVGVAAVIAFALEEAGKTARSTLDDIFGTNFSAGDQAAAIRGEMEEWGRALGLSVDQAHAQVIERMRDNGIELDRAAGEFGGLAPEAFRKAYAAAWADVKAGDSMSGEVDEILAETERAMGELTAEADRLAAEASDAGEGLTDMGAAADGAEDAMSDLQSTVDLMGRGSLKRIGKEGRDADRVFRRLMRSGDRNRRALVELNKEIGVWEKRYRRALRANDSEAAAFALAQVNRLTGERNKRQAVVDMVKEQRRTLGLLPKKTTTEVEAKVTGASKVSGLLSALRSIPRFVQTTIQAIIERVRQASGRASGGAVEPERPYWVGEFGRRELFVPESRGRVMTETQAAFSGSGGTTVNLQTYGLPMRARTPWEVAVQLRRASQLGLFEPVRRTGWTGS